MSVSRRSAISTGIVIGAALVLQANVTGAAEIRVAHWMAPEHPMDKFLMSPWAEEVNEKSGGKVTVKIYPGGALGKGPVAQFKRAVDGVTDVSFGLQGFTSPLFPKTGMIELPAMADDAVKAVDKLWDALPVLADEYARVKVLALWTNEEQILMTRDKPIRSVADMKGLKFRVPSATQGETIKALGGVPVFMSIDQVYNALQTGVIDGVMTGPSTINSFKFQEVAKYYTVGWPLGRSPFFLVMNKAKWDSLPADVQKLIDETTGRPLSRKGSAFYERAGKEGLDTVRKSKNHEVIDLSPEASREGTEILAKARSALVAEWEKKGLPARKVLAAMGVKG